MFSDETRINCFDSDGKQYIWRKSNEALSKRITRPTVKHGGSSIMIWSCFGYKGVGWSCRINGTMNSEMYLSVLQDEMARSVEWCIPPEHVNDWYFQQDNHLSK